MKTLNYKTTDEIFANFELTNNEMINVRGGSADGDPVILPTNPPIKI